MSFWSTKSITEGMFTSRRSSNSAGFVEIAYKKESLRSRCHDRRKLRARCSRISDFIS